MASELGQLRAWRRDPYPARAEIDDQGGVILDADDPAEAVLIVCHLVLNGEVLRRRSERRGPEGTCGQEAPGRGAGRFHHYQYAPLTLTITATRQPTASRASRRAPPAPGRFLPRRTVRR